jgi:hypothetical protein
MVANYKRKGKKNGVPSTAKTCQASISIELEVFLPGLGVSLFL